MNPPADVLYQLRKALPPLKAHIVSYMSMDPTAPDIEKIQVELDNLGSKDVEAMKITLERP